MTVMCTARPQRASARARALATAAAVLAAAALGWAPARLLLLGWCVLTPIELVWARRRVRVLRAGAVTDVVHFLVGGVLTTVAAVVGAVITFTGARALVLVAGQRGHDGAHWPAVVQLASTLVVLQFAQYAQHRLLHRVGWLWRFHAVHHSSEQLDWLASARVHPLEALVGGLLIGPWFALSGIAPGVLAPVTGWLTLWAVLQHANVRWRLPRLGRVLTTPEYHHWHHDRTVSDVNFAGLFPWIDSIFGTRHRPAPGVRPADPGTDAPMPYGWAAQLLAPFRRTGPAIA